MLRAERNVQSTVEGDWVFPASFSKTNVPFIVYKNVTRPPVCAFPFKGLSHRRAFIVPRVEIRKMRIKEANSRSEGRPVLTELYVVTGMFYTCIVRHVSH